MKIRPGFVSNSSSSSFVCEVCGFSESVYDGEESDFIELSCGHVICEEHIAGVKDEDLIKHIKDLANQELRKKRISKHKRDNFTSILKSDNIDEIKEMWYNVTYNKYTVIECPICTLEEILDNQLLAYIEKAHSINIEDIKSEIRKKFKNVSELTNWINKS